MSEAETKDRAKKDAEPRPWVLWISFILMFGVVALIVWGTPHFSDCVNHEPKQNAAQTIQKTQPSGTVAFIFCTGKSANENGGAITALATILLAIFTGTLYWVAGGQYELLQRQIAEAATAAQRQFDQTQQSLAVATTQANAALEQADATKDMVETLRDQTRAFLACEGGEAFLESSWIRVLMRYRNYGTTPAKNVRLVAKLFVLLPDTAKGVRFVWFKTADASQAVVPTGQTETNFHWQKADIGERNFVAYQRADRPVQINVTA